MGTFSGKTGVVMGLANDRSIAWAISQASYDEGAELAFTHLPALSNERRVKRLVEPHSPKVVVPCDVQKAEDLTAVFEAIGDAHGKLDFVVHSIAYAPPKDLTNPFVETSRDGWQMAMDISVYSLVAVCREATKLMPEEGGSIVTVSYYGGEKVVPGYNLMGVCKAALEHSVRYLAWDLGRKNIRVNSISAGPLRTLSSAGVSGFDLMRKHAARKAPMGRNIDAKEVAGTAMYLLSDLSSGVTGETVHVDCGYNIVGL